MVLPKDTGTIAICALRYCVGRRTYNKGLTAVGLTVAAYRRLSGCTPDEIGMPLSDVGKLTLYS